MFPARGTRVSSFLPETYRLDKEDEKSEFIEVYSSGELWICKPTGANQVQEELLALDQCVQWIPSNRGRGYFWCESCSRSWTAWRQT